MFKLFIRTYESNTGSCNFTPSIKIYEEYLYIQISRQTWIGILLKRASVDMMLASQTEWLLSLLDYVELCPTQARRNEIDAGGLQMKQA